MLLVGCGPRFNTKPPPKVYPVRGKVLLANGQPLRVGVVTFHPKQAPLGAEASGELDKEGSFQLTTMVKDDGALPGSYTVSVSPYSMKSGHATATQPTLIPPKYAAPETSGLTAEVKAQDNQFTFHIK
jgi:hypothetical protein